MRSPSPRPCPRRRAGTIASHLDLDKARLDRIYRRRRLGLLAAVALVVVGIGLVLQPGAEETQVAAGADPGDDITAQSSDEPVTLSAIVAETTSTLLEATTTTVAETTTTVAETTTSQAPTTTETTTAETATDAPATEAPATRARPTTTEAPATTAPPATAAAAPTTTEPPPPTTAPPSTQPPQGEYAYDDPRGTQVWLDLAQCESGGNWSIDTGNGYYGGLQFSLNAWQGVGGTGYPHEHPRDTQITMGRRLQADHGWGAWPSCSEKLGLR